MSNLDLFYDTFKDIRNYLLVVDEDARLGKWPDVTGKTQYYSTPLSLEEVRKDSINDIEFKHCYMVYYYLKFSDRIDELRQSYGIELVYSSPCNNNRVVIVLKIRDRFFRFYMNKEYAWNRQLKVDWTYVTEVRPKAEDKHGYRPI